MLEQLLPQNGVKPAFDMNHWVLVDFSFVKKHFAFAAMVKYKSAKPDVEFGENDDPTHDDDYTDELLKMFHYRLFSVMCDRVPLLDHTKVVYCLDCERHRIFRREIYPGYKANRDIGKDRFSFNGINELVGNWLESQVFNHNSKKVLVDFCEADDVIGHLTTKITKTGAKVTIISGDKDMLQLTSDLVEVVKPDGTVMTIEGALESAKVLGKFEPTPENYLTFKVIIGDSSDNIPSIKPKVAGPVKASALIAGGKEVLSEFIKSDPLVMQNFQRNHSLISLKAIPKELSGLIDEAVGSMF